MPGIVEDSPAIATGDRILVRKVNFDGREYEGFVSGNMYIEMNI